MAKIAMIGAGSLVFCKTLLSDFLATPALAGSEYRLMALTHRRLDKMRDFAERMIKDNGIRATVTATTDRREALRGADYVVVMIQVGGVDAFQLDYEIPMKYGVDNCIGDTMGPGGIFRAQRHIPALLEIAAEMQGAVPQRSPLQLRQPHGHVLLGPGNGAAGCSFVGPVPRRPDHHGPHRQLRRVQRKRRSISSPPASTTWPGS